jgi:hypothetical protein
MVELDRLYLVEGQVGDRTSGKGLRRPSQRRVVMDDNCAVLRLVDVELDGIGAPVEGTPERRQAVFGEFARSAAVPDSLHAWLFPGTGFYRSSAFGSHSDLASAAYIFAP